MRLIQNRASVLLPTKNGVTYCQGAQEQAVPQTIDDTDDTIKLPRIVASKPITVTIRPYQAPHSYQRGAYTGFELLEVRLWWPAIKLSWQWFSIIILSSIAAALVTFVFPHVILRPFVVLWFLFICPGMILVRFLPLQERILKWTFAVALSICVDALVASIFLYAGRWSPTAISSVLIAICILGVFTEILLNIRRIRAKKVII